MTLLHACPGCGKLIAYGVPRCQACQARRDAYVAKRGEKRERDREARRRAASDPKYKRFYASKEWRRLREWKLAKCGHRCERCGRPASEVHHDPPIQTPAGWERRLDPSSLHCLCTKCHNEQHHRFGGARTQGGGPKSFGPRP